jgi:hypothetical protein
MESIEKIERIRKSSNSIKNFFNVTIPKWEKNGKYDKTGYGFCEDDRFKACEGFYVWIDSHEGVYGNSNCGKCIELDKDIFKKHFICYLNKNKKNILLEIAESIEKESLKYKEDAIKELKNKLNIIENL